MKNKIRKQILEARDSLMSETRLNLSKQIWQLLFSLTEYQKAQQIMIYLNFRSEVETIPFLEHLFQDQKKVYAPVTDPQNKTFTAYQLLPNMYKLVKGPYGIFQPQQIGLPLDPYLINLIIVPGAVFDLNCQRIGYGAGYYDRFIPKLSKTATIIGIAYELQIVEQIAADKHDQPMDFVITENRIIQKKLDPT